MGKKRGKKEAKREKREKRAGKGLGTDGVLRGVSDIRRFFRANETPISAFSAGTLELLGIDRWVRRLEHVSHVDPFDGHHPRVFVPRHAAPPPPRSIEEACNSLLADDEVVERIRSRGGGKAVLPAFDEETERLAAAAGIEIASPAAELRRRLGSRIVATQLGAEGGVPSVPNVIGRASTYGVLHALSASAGLGHDLVVQTPRGDSGRTTFFVASEADWNANAEMLAGQELKVMTRIDCRAVAVEGVATRHGTLVGPLLTEAARRDGVRCANDASSLLSDEQQRQARRYAQLMGDRVREEGYRGHFELDLLADAATGAIYLDALEPRITGAGSLTTVAAVAQGELPLFLFHLLEFMDVDYELDVDELNAAWAAPWATDVWSRLVLEDTVERPERIAAAPPSGIWRLDPAARGGIRFVRPDTDWQSVEDEQEAFFLRIASAGAHRRPGADLGVLVVRGRCRAADGELAERARAWIAGIGRQFESTPLDAAAPVRTP